MSKVILPKLSTKHAWYGYCTFCKYGPIGLPFEWQTIPMCFHCGKSKFEEAGIEFE